MSENEKVYTDKAMECVEESVKQLEEKYPNAKVFEGNVIAFPDKLPEKPVSLKDEIAEAVPVEEIKSEEGKAKEETPVETNEEKPFQLNEENPLTKMSMKEITDMLKKVKELVEISQSGWEATRKEFELKDSHIKALYEFNLNNRDPLPLVTEENKDEEKQYDPNNGLDKITEEDVIKIFGEDHPIIGITHDVTKDRIKATMEEFISWMSILKEYTNIHNAYMELIEYQEEEEIKKLKDIVDKEPDEEKKANAVKALENYYKIKYLDYLQEKVPEINMMHVIRAFNDENKVQYWIEKGRSKLKQLNLSQKFILEISQFEKRFLDEKYHPQNNVLLLYFLNVLNYSRLDTSKSAERSLIVSFVVMMDRFIRNQLKPEIRERILTNIIALEEQFLGKMIKK